MSQPAIATCQWFNRSAPDFKWVPTQSDAGKVAAIECRAVVAKMLVTVWLPQGAKIRCRIPKGINPFEHTYQHRYGRTGDDLIEIELAVKS